MTDPEKLVTGEDVGKCANWYFGPGAAATYLNEAATADALNALLRPLVDGLLEAAIDKSVLYGASFEHGAGTARPRPTPASVKAAWLAAKKGRKGK